jgi:hypothetical protein
MDKYTMFIRHGKITIQEADYIEDGSYIEVIDNKITLYNIPYGGGKEIKIGTYNTILEAIEYSKTLT